VGWWGEVATTDLVQALESAVGSAPHILHGVPHTLVSGEPVLFPKIGKLNLNSDGLRELHARYYTQLPEIEPSEVQLSMLEVFPWVERNR
jgi:hypothetical protein